VLEDDPRLDVRGIDTPRQPGVVVVDSRLELPLTARLFRPGRRVWVYTAADDAAKRAALEARGATVIVLPGAGAKVDLAAMLSDLGHREINELHVEAGHKLNGSLVRGGLVDEFLVYLAPTLLGSGRGMAAIGPLASLDQGVPLEFVSTQVVGPDLRIVARVQGRDRF
jgi:diaminohydroxyphosphoribosylaminopyrimidine deaminase/5-amino-6-(5-phosphoribosylamino)uracil reductase